MVSVKPPNERFTAALWVAVVLWSLASLATLVNQAIEFWRNSLP